jgi:rRNA-processing protein FCF1
MRKSTLILTILSGVMFVLVLVNIVLSLGNQSIQLEVTERQQFISQSMQLAALSQQVIGVLASMAVKTNDQQLKNLLASSGVNLGEAPEAPAGSK